MSKSFSIQGSLGNQLRIQDIVAKVAGVGLKDTVRVLRALGIVSYYIDGEYDEWDRLNYLLARGAIFSGEPAPLHSSPDDESIEACEKAFEFIENNSPASAIQDLRKGRNDVYKMMLQQIRADGYETYAQVQSLE